MDCLLSSPPHLHPVDSVVAMTSSATLGNTSSASSNSTGIAAPFDAPIQLSPNSSPTTFETSQRTTDHHHRHRRQTSEVATKQTHTHAAGAHHQNLHYVEPRQQELRHQSSEASALSHEYKWKPTKTFMAPHLSPRLTPTLLCPSQSTPGSSLSRACSGNLPTSTLPPSQETVFHWAARQRILRHELERAGSLPKTTRLGTERKFWP